MKALLLDLAHEQYWFMVNVSNLEYEQLLDDGQLQQQASYDHITVWSNGNLEAAITSNDSMSEDALKTAIQLMFYQSHDEEHEIDWDNLERASVRLAQLMHGRTLLDDSHSNEKYFVGSEDGAPLEIYFDWQTAVAANHKYLDSFDENGQIVKQYLKTQDWVYAEDDTVFQTNYEIIGN